MSLNFAHYLCIMYVFSQYNVEDDSVFDDLFGSIFIKKSSACYFVLNVKAANAIPRHSITGVKESEVD